jgi:hypothetical protein
MGGKQMKLSMIGHFIFVHHLNMIDPDEAARILSEIGSADLPEYSMAHVRQQFIFSIEAKEKTVITKYGLNQFSKFPLESKGALSEHEGEYISACHWFCEDNDIELIFWDFYNAYSLEITKTWCLRNGVRFEEG